MKCEHFSSINDYYENIVIYQISIYSVIRVLNNVNRNIPLKKANESGSKDSNTWPHSNAYNISLKFKTTLFLSFLVA